MKKLIAICVLPLLVFSCNNNDDSDNENSSELTLKEVTSVITSNSINVLSLKFYFGEEGQPLLFEEYEGDLATDIRGEHEVYYNEDGTIDSLRLRNPFEHGFVKFEYNNGILNYLRYGTPAPPQKFIVEGNSNTIIIRSDNPSFQSNGEYIFTFTNENYERLTQYEKRGIAPNSTTSYPISLAEFFYDVNNNLETEIRKEFNDETMSFEIISEINYTYDNKINPFKNTIINSPIMRLMHHDRINIPSPIFSDNTAFLTKPDSSNNVTSITTTNYLSNLTWTLEFEYVYNELGYPISSIRTSPSSNNDEAYIKTYTYH